MLNPTPYYSMVPKGYEENLRFRKKMIQLGSESKENAHELWMMCARDVLFYINTFVWTYDPRLKHSRVIPFNTFEIQDKGILGILKRFGKEDIAFNKSRDEGVSWMMLAIIEWAWHFKDNMSFMLGSRNVDYVDKSGDPKSLFWKVVFILERQPKWLLPRYNKTFIHLENYDNKSTIDGEATTPSFGTGGRFTLMLLDEFGKLGEQRIGSDYGAWKSSADCTNCRVINGTPNGAFGCFYDVHTDPQYTHIFKVNMHWSQDPRKNQGLYKVHSNGRVEVLDGKYYEGREYKFKTSLPQNDMGYRSPWYDRECKRRFAADIAEQLDMNFLGSGSRFFDEIRLSELETEFVRPPYMTGEFDFDPNDLKSGNFRAQGNGRFKLWTHTDPKGKVAEEGPYTFGIDIGMGTGASNSVITIGNKRTGEKVGEWTCPKTRPRGFADIVVALAHWFGGAYLKWDGGGGGGKTFADRILEIGYSNIYYKTDETRIVPRRSDIPGWYGKGETRNGLYAQYASALGRTFINRSQESYNECRHFIITSKGVQHSASISEPDPSGARANHGDRTTADALCSSAMKDIYYEKTIEVEVPFGSLGWRREQAEKEKSSQGGFFE